MNWKNLRLYFLFVFLFLTKIFFGQTDSVRINEQESRIKTLEEYKDINDGKFENKSKELDLKLQEYKQDKNVLEIIVFAIGGISIIAIIGLWLRTRKIVESKIGEVIEPIIERKKEELVMLIDEKDYENKLRSDKKIIVLIRENSNDEFIKTFFASFGFKSIRFKLINHYEDVDLEYDILFLNNENGVFEDVYDQYVATIKPNTVLFNFGQIYVKPYSSYVTQRLSTANFRAQLYGNLMNALKYQDKML